MALSLAIVRRHLAATNLAERVGSEVKITLSDLALNKKISKNTTALFHCLFFDGWNFWVLLHIYIFMYITFHSILSFLICFSEHLHETSASEL